ncbi:hypothetical protein UFOVP46_50 [uncultured Caudovirales phage]|uniref:Uncharacterized protein n=1 Tax=uncultured Caudovirales phage TaxID=2100421 RepID=A0A6J5KMK0_9CAUD|nr:hypothetical protein UFOVP46_50 [uncultured Caudovirales phage]
MFVSKKKHEQKVFEARLKTMENMREGEQQDKIWELERSVKKLQKQVRKLKGIVKNGY